MKVVISTHVYATGPSQDLRDYLNEKKEENVFFIGHPLFFDKKLKGSGYEIYNYGKLKEKKYSQIVKTPSIFAYIKDVFLTVKWVVQRKDTWDIYIGCDNLNGLSGIILRKIGKVKKVIYYVIDYNPYRFSNKLTNYIYHKIDQFCVKNSDETWNLSPRMEKARKKYFNFSGGNQKVVPVGIWNNRINLKVKNIPDSVVFMGHITKKQGIQKVIKEIPKIIKKIPNFKFVIIGGGDYLEELKQMANRINISKYIEFKGYIKDHKQIEKLLPRYSLAIAPYEKFDDNKHLSFTYFADPAKIKLYLGCGLPVLISDVPYNANELELNNCGKIIKHNLYNEIIELLKNSKSLKNMKKNAIKYSEKFSWEKIFADNIYEKYNK